MNPQDHKDNNIVILIYDKKKKLFHLKRTKTAEQNEMSKHKMKVERKAYHIPHLALHKAKVSFYQLHMHTRSNQLQSSEFGSQGSRILLFIPSVSHIHPHYTKSEKQAQNF